MSEFLAVPIIRGFTEIEEIFDIAYGNSCWICGGYPRYMCSPRKDPVPAGDVDIFPVDQTAYDKVLLAFKLLDYTTKHENAISTTLKNPDKGKNAYTPTVQLIKPVNEGKVVTTGDFYEILDNFDFTVVRIGMISSISCMADPDFLADEKAGKLVFKNIHCPVSSTYRAMKYSKKGYYLPTKEALKLFVDWTNRGEDYQHKLIESFAKTEETDEDGKKKELSQKEIDELEALLRID